MKMPETLYSKDVLIITIADALGLFRGRVDRGNQASTNVVRGFSLVHDPERSHYKGERGKAHLKLKMR